MCEKHLKRYRQSFQENLGIVKIAVSLSQHFLYQRILHLLELVIIQLVLHDEIIVRSDGILTTQ